MYDTIFDDMVMMMMMMMMMINSVLDKAGSQSVFKRT